MVKALDGGFVCWETILGPDLDAKAFSERGGMQPRILWGRKGGETAISFGCREEKEGKMISRKKTPLLCRSHSVEQQLPAH